MLQRFLLVWLVLLSWIAYVWPSWWSRSLSLLGSQRFPADWHVWDPFLLTLQSGLLFYLVQVTMFCIGSLLPRDEIQQVVKKWPSVLAGTLVQYTTMPVLAFCIGTLLGLEADSFVGLMIVGSVPGAMASNVLTLTAKGNVSYSVSLTTLATLVSPLAVPFILWLTLGTTVKQDPLKISWAMLTMIVIPVVIGHFLSRKWDGFFHLMKKLGPILANLAILWIIASVVGKERANLKNTTMMVLLGLLLVNLCGYLSGYLSGKLIRLSPPMRRALVLEVGMQNCGVGTVLAADYFGHLPAAIIPPAVYTFGCMLTGTLLAQIWRNMSLNESAAD